MRAEEVDKILHELEQIRKYRRQRGDLFVEAVLEASKRIKDRYEKWYDKAIAELYKEIQLMHELVPYDELERYKHELLNVEDQFNCNKKELNKFISLLEKGQVKSFENVIVPSGEVSGTEAIVELQDSARQTADFSVVIRALNIAKKIEEIEKSVENLSNFMINVITLTKRVS
jgi:hypothetical protein